MNSPDCCQDVTQVKMGEHFCLKWNNHQENLTGIMTKLLDEQKFVDVSLVCEMKTFKAHQTVLSACSPYFQQVLEENPHPHPIIILRDVKECEMAALLQYMYRGEVNVRDHELPTFLHTARALQIRGLSDNKKGDTLMQRQESPQASSPCSQSLTPAPPKRRRISSSNPDTSPSDRHILECQQSSPLPIICKSNPTQKPSSSVSTPTYSDNLSDIQYVDSSAPSSAPPAIKLEMDGASTQSDEPFHGLAHHMSCGENASQRGADKGGGSGEQREWSVEFSSDNRSYHSQKAEPSGYTDLGLEHGRKSLTPNLPDAPAGMENAALEGLKPWSNIKYAFEKVEGSGFRCKICGQVKKHVRNHYLKHYPEHHECQLCRRTYTRKDNLNSHLKRDHFQRRKSTVDNFPRMKRPGSMKGPVYPSLKCFTPDVGLYSHVRNSSPSLNLLGGPPPMPGQPGSLQAPMDLSLRATSAPLHAPSPCGPIYDFFPSLYNMFRN